MYQQLLNGLALGSVYALVALGYALMFGVMRIINLAYGEIMMVGAFAGFAATQLLGANLGVALAAGVAGSVIVGILINELAVRPLGNVSDPHSSAHLATLITTIGASIFIQNVVLKMFGAEDHAYPRLLSTEYIQVGQVSFSKAQVVILCVTIVLMIMLWSAVRYTRWGLAVRATSDNTSVAESLGMPVRRLQLEVVIVSCILAGVAGVLVGVLDRGITPQMGVNYGLKGLAALIVGGLQSVPGAVAAAVLLGVVEVLSVAYLSDTYRDAIAYGALLVVVLVRPQGILGSAPLRF